MKFNNSTQAFPRMPLSRTITQEITTSTQITLYCILLVWSLLGNVLVIAVVYCNQNLRTNMNYLIVNMAASDLLIPLIRLPLRLYILERRKEWLVEGVLGEALCKLVHFFSDMSPFVSSISLVIIAFQRFVVVVYPTRRHILIRKTRWILIALPWIAAMVLFSPDLYIYRLSRMKCKSSWSPDFDRKTALTIFICFKLMIGLVIPLTTMIVLYSIIFHKLRTNLKNIEEWVGRQVIRSRQQTNRRIFGMSLSIIVTFIIGWCPLSFLQLFVSSVFKLLKYDYGTFLDINFVSFYLLYAQTAINPLIYFAFLRDFRRGLKRLCCCWRTTQGNGQTCTSRISYLNTVEPAGENNYELTPRNILPTPSGIKVNTRRPRTPGAGSNQDPTCTPPHIYITSV